MDQPATKLLLWDKTTFPEFNLTNISSTFIKYLEFSWENTSAWTSTAGLLKDTYVSFFRPLIVGKMSEKEAHRGFSSLILS